MPDSAVQRAEPPPNLDEVDKYLVGMAIGTRFRANFGIEDQLGKIVDTILYSEGSYFNAEAFPGVAAEVGSRQLLNERNGDYIFIDNSNVVAEVNFRDKATFVRTDRPAILEAYKKQILNGVFRNFKVKQIARIGYVNRYIFPLKTLSDSFVDKTVGRTMEGVNDINLRFSKRFPTDQTLVRKGVLDYFNVIYTIIKKADRDEIFMSVDYQYCFNPFLPSSAEIEFDSFVDRVTRYNASAFIGWIRANYINA